MGPTMGPIAGRLIGIFGICLSLAAAGCVNVTPGGKEPARLFTLSPKSTFAKQLPTTDRHLNVDMPSAGTALNSPKIALRRSAFALDYYARADLVSLGLQRRRIQLGEQLPNGDALTHFNRQADHRA